MVAAFSFASASLWTVIREILVDNIVHDRSGSGSGILAGVPAKRSICLDGPDDGQRPDQHQGGRVVQRGVGKFLWYAGRADEEFRRTRKSGQSTRCEGTP